MTRRLLTGVGATLALALGLAAPASGQTVYDYVYSGQYIDGSGSEYGQFATSSNIAGIAYDQARDRILVTIGGPGFLPGETSKVVVFKENGAPDEFSGLATGTDTIDTGIATGSSPRIAIDNTGGPDDGSFYLSGSGLGAGNSVSGFSVAGTKRPLWPQSIESVCGVTVGPEGNPWTMGATGGAGLRKFTPDGEFTGTSIFQLPYRTKDESPPGFEPEMPCAQRLDSQSYLYGAENKQSFSRWTKYTPDGKELFELSQNNNGNTDAAIDDSNDDVFTIEGNSGEIVNQYDREGKKLETFGAPDPSHSYAGLDALPSGLAVNSETHDVWVSNRRDYAGTRRIEKFERQLPGFVVPTVSVQQVAGDDLQTSTAILHGTLDPDGLETETCQFKWGLTQAVTNSVPCDQGQNLTGSGEIAVTATIPVTKGKLYWYRLQSQNKANSRSTVTGPKRFIAQGKPIAELTTVDRVNTDGARFNAEIDPNGGDTSWTFEYGSGPGFESTTPATVVPTLTEDEAVSRLITGLTPGTEYHVRIAMTNEAGTTYGETQTFLTYAQEPGVDDCDNALARQQSGSSRLLDCRGYELVSARNAGGYDVVSDLLGDEPLIGPPGAEGRLLYSIDSGSIPDIAGNPTNLGRDPYVAARDPETGAWTTRYVGLPANGMTQQGPFGSPLLGTDGSLSRFAFGGPGICDPCFPDGSINIPLREADGTLVKGMAGDPNPAADPSQFVAAPFSADGTHFVFGSEPEFADDGDEEGSIYDRNLGTGVTQVVSTTPAGTALSGGDVGELAISADGERILVGQVTSSDGQGNEYWHLYLHAGTSLNSIDLTEDASDGVLFGGMSADGSRVFMTTKDQLLATDTDDSADVYEALVAGSNADLRLISTVGGVPSNDDSCLPPGIPDSWNVASGIGKCDALAFAGGAGVAPDNGALYFVSPEQLDGSEGVKNQANLYFVEPGGNPRFVAVMDTSEGKPGPQPPSHPIEEEEFGGSFANPAGLSVDQSNGDVWVAEAGTGKVHRFDSGGAPKDFTAGPGSGTNELGGFEWLEPTMAQTAIDNSGGPAGGSIYVVDTPGFVGRVSIYGSDGALKGTLNGIENPEGSFGYACGVAVDQANGDVYIADYLGFIWRYSPSGATLAETDYEAGVNTGQESSSCSVAVSGANVYTHLFEYGEVVKFQKSVFAAAPPEPEAPILSENATGLASNPSNGDIYVDQGNGVQVFATDGSPKDTVGEGELFQSISSAVNATSQHVYATAANSIVVEFGAEDNPYTPIDNRAIVNAARQPATHSYGDFQVSADGHYAAFSTKQALTGYNTLGFEEVYRYDSDGEALDCVSCSPSGAVPASDTGLPRYGLALTDDGRVFYSTRESFALRDTNEKYDAYEWSNGKVQLLSLGLGPEDSKLLTVTPDGTDAFFFTRDTLVPEDENGSTVKIYDARENGGRVFDPALPPCAASDECHGPGSQAPPPPSINTQKGSGRSFEPSPTPAKKCKKGFKKDKKGKCVKKKKAKKKKSKRGGRA